MPQTSILKNRCIPAVKKMTYTKHERWSHNESERRLNARGYIGPLAEYSFFLLCCLYAVNAMGSCRIKHIFNA